MNERFITVACDTTRSGRESGVITITKDSVKVSAKFIKDDQNNGKTCPQNVQKLSEDKFINLNYSTDDELVGIQIKNLGLTMNVIGKYLSGKYLCATFSKGTGDYGIPTYYVIDKDLLKSLHKSLHK